MCQGSNGSLTSLSQSEVIDADAGAQSVYWSAVGAAVEDTTCVTDVCCPSGQLHSCCWQVDQLMVAALLAVLAETYPATAERMLLLLNTKAVLAHCSACMLEHCW